MRIYNCHVHVFTNASVPGRFLPLGLVWLLRRPGAMRFVRPIGRLIERVNRLLGSQRIGRFAAMINIGSLSSQQAIFERLRAFYPENARFVALSMDMAFMGAGKPAQSLVAQLDELAALKKAFPDLLFPFVAADPRREEHLDLVKRYVEEHDFAGIKLYPPLGFYPCDARLDALYAYAEANRVPILAHCSRGGVYARKRVTRDMLVHPCTGQRLKRRSRSRFTDYYTDPRNYLPVLEKYATLKLCLAHFGGGSEWDAYLNTPWDLDAENLDAKSWVSIIKDHLIRPHAHVYADISYTLSERSFLPMLKVFLQDPKVQGKILYGSDYYMLVQEGSERAFSMNVRAYLGEELYRQIAQDNARAFLFEEGGTVG